MLQVSPAKCDCSQNLIEAAHPAERQTRDGHHWLRSISLTHTSCSPQNKMGWLCEANSLSTWIPGAIRLGPSAGTWASRNLEGLWVVCGRCLGLRAVQQPRRMKAS